jgi:alanyl-tRNA synthetase
MESKKNTFLTSQDIRERFLRFFEKRNHFIIPSASLVTSDEKGITNATLFNTAGMQPLIPYLLGKPYFTIESEATDPQHRIKRLVNIQKCIRTVDINDVGDKTHDTFFEMLGNWSLGDYFKKEAINWSYEFLTSKNDGLGLDPTRLYVTVFEGDANAIRDDEAATIWREIFQKNHLDTGGDTSRGEAGRIFYLPAKNNWWEAGDSGPCGPDTEMFYDVSNTFGGKTLTHKQYVAADDAREVVEVWNDVFMQYEKRNGKIVGNLPAPSVDTGAGLERLLMTVQKVDNVYDTDLFAPLIKLTKQWSGTLVGQRIIADHIRASIFLIADGVIPSNTDRGYILRRLIRRAIVNTSDRALNAEHIGMLVDTVAETYAGTYPELRDKSTTIKKTIWDESRKFSEALAHGIKEFEKLSKKGSVSGEDAFTLFATYGLPIDSIIEFSKAKNIFVDIPGFEYRFKEHQDLSRAGAEQKFKGGLADASDSMVVRYHTATHLLHQALHDVLGEDTGDQKGSNITPERLRFDFTYNGKMSDEQKKHVEKIVNEKIIAALPVGNIIMPKIEAEKTGARHFFAEKYGDQISIYYIGSTIEKAYSKEFCGGPHVKNTLELAGPEGNWRFKITKEEAVSSGIRRIKAVLS